MTVAAAGTARAATASAGAAKAGRGAAVTAKGAGAAPPAASGSAGSPAGSGSAARRTSSSAPSSSPAGSGGLPFPAVQPPQVVDDGAGFVLGVLLWVWVVLPFLRGGTGEVRNVLRAKFFNKAADGSWLP